MPRPTGLEIENHEDGLSVRNKLNKLLVGAYDDLWTRLVLLWKVKPTKIGMVPEGDVYEYVYSDFTAYRLVPTDGVTTDAFYAVWDGSSLSVLIASRETYAT